MRSNRVISFLFYVLISVFFHFNFNVFAADSSKELQPLGHALVQEEDVLIFGGSFSPPTLEHMGIPTRLMDRFGFSKARMLVAKPYKAGAAPADVSVGLTKIAVSHVNEVLTINAIDFSQFQSREHGKATWIGKQGRKFELGVDDREIHRPFNPDPETTLVTLRELGAEAKDPRKNYWVSGGDSFSSVPQWGEHWRELFDHTNWVVISRPGFENDPTQINFNLKNPLLPVFGEAFVANYIYFFDQTHQIHVYKNRNSAKPDIYIIDMPMLEDSSSQNRKSLQETGDRQHAQAGLQPSVFKACVVNGYYDAKDEEVQVTDGQFKVFTRKNLEIYSKWLFDQIEVNAAPSLTSEQREDFHQASSMLVQIVAESVEEENQLPVRLQGLLPQGSKRAAVYGFLAHLMGHIAEHLGEIKNITRISEKMREIEKEYGVGKFAAVVLGVELAETLVVPPTMYFLFGPKGLAFVPFIHPNEFFVIPSYLLWTLYKKLDEKRRLAETLSKYKILQNYRTRLLRGDPDSILSNLDLEWPLGVDGTHIAFNIVKSRLPGWIPLAIRNWDDRKVTWYDLNVSTNELKGILGNSDLADEIYEASGKEKDLFANHLVTAILQEPTTRARFELFMGQRYFQKIAFSDVPRELISGFSESEQKALASVAATSAQLSAVLSNEEFKDVSFVLGDLYAVLRAVQLNPDNASSSTFWTEVINLMITRYPGKQVSRGDKRILNQSSGKILALVKALYFLAPNLFEGAVVSHQNMALLLVGPEMRVLYPEFTVPKHQQLHADVVARTVENYVHNHGWIFKMPNSATLKVKQPRALVRPSVFHEGIEQPENLVWEINLAMASIAHQSRAFETSFNRALQYLKARQHHKKAPKLFVKAQKNILKDLDQLKAQLKAQDFAWAEAKYRERTTDLAQDEQRIAGYSPAVEEFNATKAKVAAKFDQYRALTQMVFGSIVVDVQDPKAIEESVKDLVAEKPCVKALKP